MKKHLRTIITLISLITLSIVLTSCNLQKATTSNNSDVSTKKESSAVSSEAADKEPDIIKSVLLQLANDEAWVEAKDRSFFLGLENQTFDMEIFKNSNDPNYIWVSLMKNIDDKQESVKLIQLRKDSRGFLDEPVTYTGESNYAKGNDLLKSNGYLPYKRSKIKFDTFTKPVYPEITGDREKAINNIESIVKNEIKEGESFKFGRYKIFIRNFRSNNSKTYVVIENGYGSKWIKNITLSDSGKVEGGKLYPVNTNELEFKAERYKEVAIQKELEIGQIPQDPTQQSSLNYSNNKYKFTLTFPESWKEKYFIEETKNGINVLYNTEVGKKKNIAFFGIGRVNKSEWIEDNSGFTEKICEQNGLVYYAIFPSQAGFEMHLENEKKEAEEFRNLNKETKSIIKSLKVIE